MADSAVTDYTSLNLYQKLARITGDIGAIKKGGRNTEQNFDFIEYAAVAGELRTLFARYGVVVIPRMQQAHKQARSEVTSKYGKVGYAVLSDRLRSGGGLLLGRFWAVSVWVFALLADWRYPARILDLKHEGHNIRSVHDKGTRWWYIYEGETST